MGCLSRASWRRNCTDPDTGRNTRNHDPDEYSLTLEFRDTLHLLADGKVNATPIRTGNVGLSGVEAAFGALTDPEHHAKIVIDPRTTSTSPTTD